MAFIHKVFLKFWHPIRGFLVALRDDVSFKLDMIVGVGLIVFGCWARPLSDLELFSLVLSFALILITELQNTSIETALDTIHPEYSDRIGTSKDIAAAAAVVALCFAAFVVVWITLTRI